MAKNSGTPKLKDATMSTATLKYEHPKILSIDLGEAVDSQLKSKGFNVSSGTFGYPYKVPVSANYVPVYIDFDLPNLSEQEIVIVDLTPNQTLNNPRGEKHNPMEENDWWVKCNRGIVDPRTRSGVIAQKSFDQIYQAGGVFVVFADAPTDFEYKWANRQFGNFYPEADIGFNNWSFLSELKKLEVQPEPGKEITLIDTSGPVERLLAKFLVRAEFHCVLKQKWLNNNRWIPLAQNKYGRIVAVAIAPDDEEAQGWIFVFPQIQDKASFLVELLHQALPEISPYLFPQIEKGRWTHSPEYEIPRILEIQGRQARIREEAESEIKALESQIGLERVKYGWMHDLLTGTDAPLVEAVKTALHALGFNNVVDVDEERDREGRSRREDLQINDRSPTLIVDIKGIGGYPSDEDALQASKHASIRMREWKRTDVNGLSLINHQRHLPPLERGNQMPFRQELLHAAEEQAMGLMTAWDLYRVVRNFQKHSWRQEDVLPIFYRAGRIGPIPAHYTYIGRVVKAWTDKFGVVIEAGDVRLGDRIAVEFDIEFEEAEVSSLMVNNKSVNSANVNDPAGFSWSTEKPRIREGLRVYRIRKKESGLQDNKLRAVS